MANSHPVWHPFEVDGTTYYWRTYAESPPIGSGPWEPAEKLDVSTEPDRPGIGKSFPAGTVVTEEHAMEVVCLVAALGHRFP
jgi:hypothetical protein